MNHVSLWVNKWIYQPIRLKMINLAKEQMNAFMKHSSDSLKNANSQIKWVIESFIQTFGSFIHKQNTHHVFVRDSKVS